MADTDQARRRCAAIAKKTGRQCSHPAQPGSEFCAVHGGMRAGGGISPAYPSEPVGPLLERISELRRSPDLFALGAEVATLKALLEHALDRLEAERGETDDGTGAYTDPSLKRVQSITMDILSASEKIARVEERRRGVLTASEIGAIIDRIKERVIHVVSTAQEDDSPEETAGRIAEAFSSIEIVGSGG